MPFPRFKPLSNITGLFEIVTATHGYGQIADTTLEDGKWIRSYNWSTGAVVKEFEITAISHANAASFLYERMWSTPDQEFLLVRDETTGASTPLYHLFRAASEVFNSWTLVYSLGVDGLGGNNTSVEFLGSAGYSAATGKSYFAEYNPRTTGSTGSYRTAFGEVNSSGVWTELASWNELATSTAGILPRHIHGVTVDPDSGFVYLMTGDSTAQSWIIIWDPATGTWADDMVPADFTSTTGFASITTGVENIDSCRAININFSGNYLFWISDADGTAIGVWRAERSLTDQNPTPTTSNMLSLFPNQGDGVFGWNNFTLNDGRTIAFLCPHTITDPEQAFIRIYASDDAGGLNYQNVGILYTDQGAGVRVERVNYIPGTNRIVISFNFGAGMPRAGSASQAAAGQMSTTIVELWNDGSNNLEFKEERPDILWPCRFVAKTNALGVTSKDGVTGAGESSINSTTWHGFDEFNTWLTLEHALETSGGIIGYGTRVMVGAGDFIEDSIIPRFTSATGFEILDGDYVVVTGEGTGNTFFTHAEVPASDTSFTVQQPNDNIEFERCFLRSSRPSGTSIFSGHGSNTTKISLRDCETGGDNINLVIRARTGLFRAIRSIVRAEISPSGSNQSHCPVNTLSNGGACLITFLSSIVGGGYTNIRLDDTGVTLEMINTVLEGLTERGKGIWSLTNAPDEIYIRNNVWLPLKATSEEMFDNGVTPTSIDIDFNYDDNEQAFVQSNTTNLIESGKGVLTAASLYEPQAGSTLVEAGETLSAIETKLAEFLNNDRFKMDAKILDINGNPIISTSMTIGINQLVGGLALTGPLTFDLTFDLTNDLTG